VPFTAGSKPCGPENEYSGVFRDTTAPRAYAPARSLPHGRQSDIDRVGACRDIAKASHCAAPHVDSRKQAAIAPDLLLPPNRMPLFYTSLRIPLIGTKRGPVNCRVMRRAFQRRSTMNELLRTLLVLLLFEVSIRQKHGKTVRLSSGRAIHESASSPDVTGSSCLCVHPPCPPQGTGAPIRFNSIRTARVHCGGSCAFCHMVAPRRRLRSFKKQPPGHPRRRGRFVSNGTLRFCARRGQGAGSRRSNMPIGLIR